MSNVYSTLLVWEKALAGDSTPAGPNPGFVWVIRDITVYNGNTLEIVDASITGLDGIVLWATEWNPVDAQAGLSHELCHIVIPAVDGFVQLHATFPVDFYISGFQLSLP